MRRWMVEFNFENGRCMEVKMGFETKELAEKWNAENTTDGKIVEYFDLPLL